MVQPDGLGEGDRTGWTTFFEFAEEGEQFVAAEVFEDASVGEEEALWRRVLSEPVHDVRRFEAQAGIRRVDFVTGGDLAWIEVDAEESIESLQAGGKMGEDEPVTGSDLDDPGTPPQSDTASAIRSTMPAW
jgi:hypothetical protein